MKEYRIKNEDIEKQILSIFEQKSVAECVAKQMAENPQFVYVGDGLQIKADLREDKQHLKPLEIVFRLPATELEEVPPYKPRGWNPYPQVVPPRCGDYLVQLEDFGTPNLEVAHYTTEHIWDLWALCDDTSSKVVAFRELPPLYSKPKEQNVPMKD